MADVDLEDVLSAYARAATGEVYTAMAARVLAFDAETRRARVQGLTALRYKDEDGAVRFDDPPIIGAVPVLFPGFAGRRLTWPVNVGDDGLVVILDRSHDEYQSNGEAGEPASPRRHNFTDAVFIPFDISPGASDEYADGAIVATGDDIRLGSKDATDAVALAPTTYANDLAIEAALDAILAAAATAAVGVAGATTWTLAQPILATYFNAVVAAVGALSVTDPAASKVTAE